MKNDKMPPNKFFEGHSQARKVRKDMCYALG